MFSQVSVCPRVRGEVTLNASWDRSRGGGGGGRCDQGVMHPCFGLFLCLFFFFGAEIWL